MRQRSDRSPRFIPCVVGVAALAALGIACTSTATPPPVDAMVTSERDVASIRDATSGDGAAGVDAATDVAATDVPDDDAGRDDAGGCAAPCADAMVCIAARCCRPAVPRGAFTVPAHAGYLRWTFPGSGARVLEFTLEVRNDPGTAVGLYYAPFDGSVGATQFYFGLQTNLSRPGVGPVGKGFIFSAFGNNDGANVRTAPGGFAELGTHEGLFIGVRLPYEWHEGVYRLRLQRGEGDASGDWFNYSVVDDARGVETPIGALRFARATPETPGLIQPRGVGFAEIYSGATNYAAVPSWTLALQATADGLGPIGVRSEYPAFPTAEYPNVDEFYDRDADRFIVTYGGLTPRCHPPATLLSR